MLRTNARTDNGTQRTTELVADNTTGESAEDGTNGGGVLKCMLINGGQTKSNGDTVYLRCGSSKYHLLSPLPWAEYKAKRQIRQ